MARAGRPAQALLVILSRSAQYIATDQCFSTRFDTLCGRTWLSSRGVADLSMSTISLQLPWTTSHHVLISLLLPLDGL